MIKRELIKLYKSLSHIRNFIGLEPGWTLLNPYADNFDRFEFFTNRFYSDNKRRDIIFALNPGRLGCGKTGITLTDENILISRLGYPDNISKPDREKTATRIYSVIGEVFGGDFDAFFSKFFMSNIFPFGVVDEKGNNAAFDDIMKISAVSEFSFGFVRETLNIFHPERMLCVGLGSHKFITRNFPDYNPVYLHHPARVFPEEKKKVYRKHLSECIL